MDSSIKSMTETKYIVTALEKWFCLLFLPRDRLHSSAAVAAGINLDGAGLSVSATKANDEEEEHFAFRGGIMRYLLIELMNQIKLLQNKWHEEVKQTSNVNLTSTTTKTSSAAKEELSDSALGLFADDERLVMETRIRILSIHVAEAMWRFDILTTQLFISQPTVSHLLSPLSSYIATLLTRYPIFPNTEGSKSNPCSSLLSSTSLLPFPRVPHTTIASLGQPLLQQLSESVWIVEDTKLWIDLVQQIDSIERRHALNPAADRFINSHGLPISAKLSEEVTNAVRSYIDVKPISSKHLSKPAWSTHVFMKAMDCSLVFGHLLSADRYEALLIYIIEIIRHIRFWYSDSKKIIADYPLTSTSTPLQLSLAMVNHYEQFVNAKLADLKVRNEQQTILQSRLGKSQEQLNLPIKLPTPTATPLSVYTVDSTFNVSNWIQQHSLMERPTYTQLFTDYQNKVVNSHGSTSEGWSQKPLRESTAQPSTIEPQFRSIPILEYLIQSASLTYGTQSPSDYPSASYLSLARRLLPSLTAIRYLIPNASNLEFLDLIRIVKANTPSRFAAKEQREKFQQQKEREQKEREELERTGKEKRESESKRLTELEDKQQMKEELEKKEQAEQKRDDVGLENSKKSEVKSKKAAMRTDIERKRLEKKLEQLDVYDRWIQQRCELYEQVFFLYEDKGTLPLIQSSSSNDTSALPTSTIISPSASSASSLIPSLDALDQFAQSLRFKIALGSDLSDREAMCQLISVYVEAFNLWDEQWLGNKEAVTANDKELKIEQEQKSIQVVKMKGRINQLGRRYLTEGPPIPVPQFTASKPFASSKSTISNNAVQYLTVSTLRSSLSVSLLVDESTTSSEPSQSKSASTDHLSALTTNTTAISQILNQTHRDYTSGGDQQSVARSSASIESRMGILTDMCARDPVNAHTYIDGCLDEFVEPEQAMIILLHCRVALEKYQEKLKLEAETAKNEAAAANETKVEITVKTNTAAATTSSQIFTPPSSSYTKLSELSPLSPSTPSKTSAQVKSAATEGGMTTESATTAAIESMFSDVQSWSNVCQQLDWQYRNIYIYKQIRDQEKHCTPLQLSPSFLNPSSSSSLSFSSISVLYPTWSSFLSACDADVAALIDRLLDFHHTTPAHLLFRLYSNAGKLVNNESSEEQNEAVVDGINKEERAGQRKRHEQRIRSVLEVKIEAGHIADLLENDRVAARLKAMSLLDVKLKSKPAELYHLLTFALSLVRTSHSRHLLARFGYKNFRLRVPQLAPLSPLDLQFLDEVFFSTSILTALPPKLEQICRLKYSNADSIVDELLKKSRN